MSRCLFIILLLTPTLLAAADEPLGPASAKSTEELIAVLKARVPKLFGSQPPLSTKELKGKDRRLFVSGYCPTSGEATCQVQVYQFDSEKREWIRFHEQFFHGTHDVKPELDGEQRLILRDVKGKEIYREAAK